MSKLILCTAIIASLPALAPAAELYSLTVLSTDQSFRPTSANDSGEFVGYTLDQHDNQIPAYFKDGVVTSINVPGPGTFPFVGAISTNGDFPVVSQNPTNSYVFSNGVLTPLPVSNGTFGAQFVSPNGDVAGSFLASDGLSGGSAIYRNGQLTLLPGDEYFIDANARGDFLVGSNAAPFILHPDGSATSLPSLPDGIYTHISSNGIVTGYRPLGETLPGGTPPPPGFFIITNGNLQFFDNSHFSADAINASGTAVGDTYFGSGPNFAAIFQNGSVTPLDPLVSDKSWFLERPLSISDNGTIYLLGINEQSNLHGLLELTPISGGSSLPEPTSLLLLPLSLLALHLRRPSRA